MPVVGGDPFLSAFAFGFSMFVGAILEAFVGGGSLGAEVDIVRLFLCSNRMQDTEQAVCGRQLLKDRVIDTQGLTCIQLSVFR